MAERIEVRYNEQGDPIHKLVEYNEQDDKSVGAYLSIDELANRERDENGDIVISLMTDREILEEIAITMRGVRAGLAALSEHPVLGNMLGGLGGLRL